MSLSRAERKVALLRQAEQMVDDLLKWEDVHQRPNLTEIEDIVLALRKRIGEQMAQAVVDHQATLSPVPGPTCPTCGREMHAKSRKRRRVESRAGSVPLERTYYYCDHCRRGSFPLDEQLAVWDCHWSEHLAKYSVWLSGLRNFDQAAEILGNLAQVSISSKSVWRLAQRWGQRTQAMEALAQAAANATPDRQQLVPGEAPSQERLAVALDGGMRHIRDEGWKELKVGCVGQVAVRPTRDKATGDRVPLAHTLNPTYVAHLGGPDVFGQQLWAEAHRRHRSQAAETVALGDGAAWIWNLVGQHFYDSQQVVDWYHAKQHLAQAANLIHGEGTPAAGRWLSEQETRLFEGHAAAVAECLLEAATHKRKLAKDLRQQAGYFRDNQRRMQYLELRENEFPLGSGMVESGCKQFRERFAGPGMRWSRPGAERLLPVRAAILSRRFDALWARADQPALN